jgi:DNA mismatch repair protein MutL
VVTARETKQVSWEDLGTEVALAKPKSESIPGLEATASLPILRVMGQLSNTYIIAEGPEGLYLIDQHAAHERILYEELMSQRRCRQVVAQGMLQPLNLELTVRQEEVLKENMEALSGFGFSLEPFGERNYLVRSVPAIIKDRNIAEALRSVIDTLSDTLSEGKAKANWEEVIAISLACHGAVRAGQTLSAEELRELVRLLEKSSAPRTCPHGRPTMLHLSSGRLEREFGRR